MARAKRKHSVKTTVFIMGEGLQDKTFLAYMKKIYDDRNSSTKITLSFSSGGSPHNIIKDTIKTTQHNSFDKKYILLDDDVTVRQQDYDKANKHKIEILKSEPICLEGMLLTILNMFDLNNLPTANSCKKKLHQPSLLSNPNDIKSYEVLISKDLLDRTDHKVIKKLRNIIKGESF